jgi:hypothetical protein
MILRASAWSVWHIARHGEREHKTLERIKRKGLVTQNPIHKPMNREHQSVGAAIKANYFISHKFLENDGTVEYQNTSWQCKTYRMPLCKLSQINIKIGQTEICLLLTGTSRILQSQYRVHFICHKSLRKEGTVEYQNTSWQCKRCRMSLCR